MGEIRSRIRILIKTDAALFYWGCHININFFYLETERLSDTAFLLASNSFVISPRILSNL